LVSHPFVLKMVTLVQVPDHPVGIVTNWPALSACTLSGWPAQLIVTVVVPPPL
jgi:hypothetical protein